MRRSRTPTARATSASSSRRHAASATTCSSTPTTRSSIRRSRCCRSSGRCRPRCERPLAGQSKNLFNLTAEYALGGFSTRLLFNYFGDRISDVGANEAPDIIEQGRGSLDLVLAQRIRGLSVRLTLENLTDADYLFTQTLTVAETQRLFRLGRTIALSVGYNVF